MAFLSRFLFASSTMVLTATVITNAFYQKKQFYPSVVHLTNSSPSMAVIYMQGLVLVWLFGLLLRKIFFGVLRSPEVEHMVDEFWYAVPETCLLFAAFRENLSPFFVTTLTFLFFFKAFHWLADARIDFMERSPVITRKFHVRAIAMLIFLIFVDGALIAKSATGVLTAKPSVEMVFALEYTVLLLLALSVLAKYVLNTIDLQSENPWDYKTVYMAYVQVVLGFLKMTAFFGFMIFMAKVHIFPLYITRRVFMAIRNFKKSVQDIVLSRKAIYNLNNLYPDVTAEELQSGDAMCVICREEMTENAKKLPCKHIFHSACLRSWFQRQQVCPTCRIDVLSKTAELQAIQLQRERAVQRRLQNQQADNPIRQNGEFPQIPQNLQQLFAPQPLIPQQEPPAENTENAPEDKNDSEDKENGGPPQDQPNFSLLGSLPPFSSGFQTLDPKLKDTLSQNGSFPQLPPIPPHLLPLGAMPTDPKSLRLSLLTDEELMNLEGEERKNVEARIAVLRNIQLLLDSAVAQVNQYYVVTGSLPFQDRLVLTDLMKTTATGYNRPTKKVASSMGSAAPGPSSTSTTLETTPTTATPPQKINVQASEDVTPSVPLHRSMTWSPQTPSTPSVFGSVLEDKDKADESQDDQPDDPQDDQPVKRSISMPPSSDAELRQRRLEKLEDIKRSSSQGNSEEK